MLTGGFYSMDAKWLCQDVERTEFTLPLDVNGIYKRKVYTNNGRTATMYALEQAKERLRGRKILLPDYLCASILTAVEAVGVEYDFYRVNARLEVDIEDLRGKAALNVGMIYIIHYFAVPQPESTVEAMKALAKQKEILLFEDITQALFSKDEHRMGFGDFVAASTRKWFPMTDGGMVAIRDDVELREIPLQNPYNEAAYKELLISVMRDYYSQNPTLPLEEYIQFEREANASRYVDLEIRKMTEASEKVFFNSNKQELMLRRRENYTYLYQAICDNQHFTLLGMELEKNRDWIPFGMVLLTQNRDKLYDYLLKHGVIAEIQWKLPCEAYQPGKAAAFMSEHNLMLQCDQRYNLNDMQRIAEILGKYVE